MVPASFKKILIGFTVLALLVGLSFVGYKLAKQSKPVVLSAKTASSQSSPSPSPKPSPSPTPSPSPRPKLSKSTYTIALIGDSLIDTMGENLEYLEKSLKAKYPETKFNLYNFGIGSQNVEQGLKRFNSPFTNRARNYPPISQINADIIVLGSFAYNPFDPHDKNRHYLTLIELVKEAKKTNAQIYQLAEIAPKKVGFGKGTNGINWPEDKAELQAAHIVEQLENAKSVATNQNIILIGAFSPSQAIGEFGSGVYTDGNDGIHPSVQGHVFMANLIAQTLKLH